LTIEQLAIDPATEAKKFNTNNNDNSNSAIATDGKKSI